MGWFRQLTIVVMQSTLTSFASLAGDPSGVRPEALSTFRKATDYLRHQTAYQVRIEIYRPSCSREYQWQIQELAVARPDKLALTPRSRLGVGVACDGKRIIAYAPQNPQYHVIDPPLNLHHLTIAFWQLVPEEFLRPLLVSNSHESALEYFLTDVTSGVYVAKELMHGRECHRLKFIESDKEWDVWIDAGDEPLLRRIVVNGLKGRTAQQAASQPISSDLFDQEIAFSDWKTNPDLSPELFIFKAPAGAEADTHTYRELFEGYFSDERYPLIGQPAPVAELPLLDGDTLELGRYRGDKIVVLYFWATWCIPCRQSLPAISQVGRDLEAKGVRLFAVDLKEDTATVRDWVARHKIACPVLLDRDGRCKEAFHVQAIPAIVVIDKSGVVRSYATRSFPSLPREKRLREELEALVADGQLDLPCVSRPAAGTQDEPSAD